MARRKLVSWVVMGPEPYFATCQRCGVTEERPKGFPMPVNALLRYCDYVSEKHRFCVPQQTAAGQEASRVAS